mgnify:FL=1
MSKLEETFEECVIKEIMYIDPHQWVYLRHRDKKVYAFKEDGYTFELEHCYAGRWYVAIAVIYDDNAFVYVTVEDKDDRYPQLHAYYDAVVEAEKSQRQELKAKFINNFSPSHV